MNWYADLAAEAPRIDRLNTLGNPNFPFDADAIKHSVKLNDHLMVRIPYAAYEKLYGYSLQFDKGKESKLIPVVSICQLSWWA